MNNLYSEITPVENWQIAEKLREWERRRNQEDDKVEMGRKNRMAKRRAKS
jgi:hypothetical protein